MEEEEEEEEDWGGGLILLTGGQSCFLNLCEQSGFHSFSDDWVCLGTVTGVLHVNRKFFCINSNEVYTSSGIIHDIYVYRQESITACSCYNVHVHIMCIQVVAIW